MTTFLGIRAGVATFVVTQFTAALLIALFGTWSRFLGLVFSSEPYRTVLRLVIWSSCGWLGVLVYGAIAG
jgi:hypothetical protein